MTALFLLLAACAAGGGKAEERALEARTRMISMERCSFTAEISADYGNRTYDFTVTASYQKDGESILSVTKPDSLSGISVTYSSLSFDGARIETGSLSSQGLSPLSAFPALLAAARTGDIAETGFETLGGIEAICFTCRESADGETLEQKLWFDPATGAPLRGEILVNGDLAIACVFTQFQFGD
jgi:outer membrane lipoprotein-sorting protein